MTPAESVICCVWPRYIPLDGMRRQLSDVISGYNFTKFTRVS